jgi:hypothetical protein
MNRIIFLLTLALCLPGALYGRRIPGFDVSRYGEHEYKKER